MDSDERYSILTIRATGIVASTYKEYDQGRCNMKYSHKQWMSFFDKIIALIKGQIVVPTSPRHRVSLHDGVQIPTTTHGGHIVGLPSNYKRRIDKTYRTIKSFTINTRTNECTAVWNYNENHYTISFTYITRTTSKTTTGTTSKANSK